MSWIEDNTSKDPIAKVDMRIRMLKMNPREKDPIDEDLEGTITNIDGLGTLHVRWDDGRILGVIPPIYHTVKNREKITDILKKYSVNLEDLMEWNDLKTMDIEKGQKLKIVIDEYELLPPLDDQIGLDFFGEGKAGKEITKLFKAETKNIDPKVKFESEQVPGGKAQGMAIKDLAKKHNVSVEDIEKEIKVGTKIELEHTDSKKMAKEIAMDHIAEFPDYYTNKKYGVKASEKGLEKELEETTTTGALGATPIQPLGNPIKNKKSESKVIKAKDLINEITNTGNISSTVDFLINNLMGWGTLKDMSPPWPSLTKKADNGEKEDWWWQKIPTYNGGVITDPYAKTDEVWDDDKLEVNIDKDMNTFKRDIEKNPKKYKQTVITTNKGFDLNIDPPNNDWKIALQKGTTLKTQKSNDPVKIFRNKVSSRTIKKEEISLFTDNLINEVKKKKEDIHTAKWKRCFEKVSKEKGDEAAAGICTDSIGYEGSIKEPHRKKEDLEETTTFGSVFGSGFPVTPFLFSKKGKHSPSKKPIWKGGQIIQKVDRADLLGESLIDEINKVKWVKGGKYVKIKDKCAKYNNQPWCSQGAIDNPLELSDSTFENIQNISKKTGLSEEEILNNVLKFINEDTFHKLSWKDKLKIKLAGIGEDQVIYNLNNNLPIDWNGTKEGYYEKMEPKNRLNGTD